MSKFRFGDIVKGTDDHYDVTNRQMTKGEVVRTDERGFITVKVLEHVCEGYLNEEFNVEEKHFELADEPENNWGLVASIFGRELDEEFELFDSCLNPYKFTDKGLVDCCGDIWSEILWDFISIKKIPWKPEERDIYYYVSAQGAVVCTVFSCEWESCFFHLILGNCFSTYEEAEANKK